MPRTSFLNGGAALNRHDHVPAILRCRDLLRVVKKRSIAKSLIDRRSGRKTR